MYKIKLLIVCCLLPFHVIACKGPAKEDKSEPASDFTEIVDDRSGSIALEDSPKQKETGNNISEQFESQIQDTLHCNIRIVRDTENSIEVLDSESVKLFLQTFSKECLSNAEFSEFGNRVLFQVLELYPSEVLSLLESQEQVDTDFILDINAIELIKKVEGANGNNEIKEKVIGALKEAM
jgi:hypothetical protein